MTEYMTKEPSRYVMSLDSLDLSLLPTIQSRLNNNTLWSTSNQNTKDTDYYQFEIMPKTDSRTSLSNDDDYVLKKLTTCHVCNIRVPSAYISDHENSLKHKTFVRIADVVLERARRHMLKKEDRCNVQRLESMYLCGPCVSVIQISEKKAHEKSKAHKQAQAMDKLLYELATLYTDEENEDEEIDSNNDDINEVESTFSENMNDTILISDMKARLDQHEIINKKTVDKYRTLNSHDSSPKDTKNNDETVTIETLDGCEIVIPNDHFHGFVRFNNVVNCELCKVAVKNEDEHKSSEQHVSKILTPFKDKHCVRNLDSSWSHCVICNKIVDDSDLHALCNESHDRLLEKALVVYKTPPNKFNILINQNVSPETKSPERSLEHFCWTCNLSMHVNNVQSHMNGNKHAMNSKSAYHYIMKPVEDSIDVLCRVCDVYVPDDVDEVDDHVKTIDHRNKFKEFLQKNQVIEQGDKLFCIPCNLSMLKKNEFYHIEKLSHEVSLGIFNDKTEVTNHTVVNAKPSTSSPTDNDTNNNNNNTKLVVNENNKTLISEDNKTLISEDAKINDAPVLTHYCDVCSVFVPNNPKNIQGHNDGDKHRKNLVKQEVKETIQETKNIKEKSTLTNVHYHMELTKNEKELRCKVCESIIPNKKNNVDEHINGLKHKSNVYKIMVDNHLEIKDERFYCNVCKVFIKNEKEFLHVGQLKHANLVKIATQKGNVKIDDMNNSENKPSTSKQVNTVSDLDKVTEDKSTANNVCINLYSILKHHFGEVKDDPDVLNCLVCDVTIANTMLNALHHVDKTEHKDSYKNLIARHLIFETDTSSFFCGICNCLVPGKGEFHHLFGSKHVDKYLKVISADNCDLCDVKVPGQDLSEHLLTEQHVKKIKQNQTCLNYCNICGMLITKTEGVFDQHTAKCFLMLEHRLIVKDKICFCTICDLYFALELIEEHIQSNHHMLLYNMIK